MTEELKNLAFKIQVEKKRLADLYESKGQTDFEVLEIGDKLDRLINMHDKLANN